MGDRALTTALQLRPAVFLDRDGVINANVLNPRTGAFESPHAAADFRLLPGVPEALARLDSLGLLLFSVSNQPSHAKDKCSMADLEAVHASFAAAAAAAGVRFQRFYYCYHHPQGVLPGLSGPCDCRKPSPYFLHQAAAEFAVDLKKSWMVGDRATDIQCGKAAGVRTIRVREPNTPPKPGDAEPDYWADDLLAAAAIIAGQA